MCKILLLSQYRMFSQLRLDALARLFLRVLVRLATDAHDGEEGQLRLGPACLGVEELASRLTSLVQALFESERFFMITE